MLTECLPNIWVGTIHELQSYRRIQKELDPVYLFVFVYGINNWAVLYPWIHKRDLRLAQCPYTLIDTSISTIDISIIKSTGKNVIVFIDPESVHMFSNTPFDYRLV